MRCLTEEQICKMIQREQRNLQPFYARLANIEMRKPVKILLNLKTNEMTFVRPAATAEEIMITNYINERMSYLDTQIEGT